MSISADIDAAQRLYPRSDVAETASSGLSRAAVREGCRRGRDLHALAVNSALHSLSSAIASAFGVAQTDAIRS